MFLRRTRIGKSYRNILRLRQIVAILLKHGFHDFVAHSNLLNKFKLKDKFIGDEKYNLKTKRITNSHWHRLRLVLEELGPTYIKLGQFLSNRPDIVPSELCDELEKLLDDVPPFSGNMARMILEKELNASINDIFKHFSKNPFSAASISQVHEGILKNGKKVAVKIQRPGIKSIIDADIDIMYHIAKLIKKHVEGADVINPTEIVDEFKDGILHELDFENEAINIEKFHAQFKDNANIEVPAVYKEYSSKKVLCMEYMEGIKFTELDTTDKDLDVDTITTKLVDLVLMQIFDTGFFHADPHASN
jgi:ubiquinone biosynthesis protein